MVQKFQPCRIALALVLSVVLVLSVAQLTQAKTAQKPAYPSRAQAEEAILYYYNFLGPFREKNVFQGVDSITYGPIYGTGTYNRFGACVQYRFVSGPSYKPTQTARHIFTFQYGTPLSPIGKETWVVVGMDLNPC